MIDNPEKDINSLNNFEFKPKILDRGLIPLGNNPLERKELFQ